MDAHRPNVALLLLDAARCRNFSCYGYEQETTPFIDKLADDGTRYEYAFANSIFSLPSYATIFTGQYPTEHGALDWGDRVRENVLVDGLKDAGYETLAVSTHLVSDEFGIGDAFDQTTSLFLESKDVLYDDDPVSERMREHAGQEGWESERQKYLFFLREFLRRPSYKSTANGAYKLYRKFRKSRGYWDDDGGRRAVETAKGALDDVEGPFFLFINFIETHDPYRPPREYLWDFLPPDTSLSEVKSALEYVSTLATAGRDDISARQRRILLGLYDAEIRYVDDLIGEFVTYLEANGLRENTVLIVLSDHGDAFGEHGLWGHQGRVYNELCHVPLVIDYPWRSREVVGQTTELRELCDHIVSLANGGRDRMPAGGEALVEYYGWDTQLSFAPWEKYEEISFDEWGRYQAAMVVNRAKLIRDAANRRELYDIESDIFEETDLIRERPETANRLDARLRELVGDPVENDRRYRDSLDVGLDGHSSELTEHLRDLGYVD